jgi:hypothetical protein
VFKIRIINGCNPPYGFQPALELTPPVYEAQTYVVGSPKKSYLVPEWITSPAHCAGEIVYQQQVLINGQYGVAAVFDGTYVHMEYPNGLDVAGSTPEGKTYTVTIMVQLSGVMSKVEFDITFLNPCLTSMMTTDITLLDNTDYLLGSGTHTWNHEAFNVPFTNVCGGVKYTADFGELTGTVQYNAAVKTFIMSSSDSSLMSGMPYTYTVTSEYINYPGYGRKTGEGKIYLTNPCENPESVQVGLPQPAGSDFTEPAVCVFPTVIVQPAQCIDYAVYTCTFDHGPVEVDDLVDCDNLCGCSFTNGNFHTEITFDITTGTLIFNTDDTVTFPQGEYVFSVSVQIGVTIEITSVKVLLTEQCETPELAIVYQPAP